jgi:hypothetical protein
MGPRTPVLPLESAGNVPISPFVGPVQENRTCSPGVNPAAVARYDSPIGTCDVVNAIRATEVATDPLESLNSTSTVVAATTVTTATAASTS